MRVFEMRGHRILGKGVAALAAAIALPSTFAIADAGPSNAVVPNSAGAIQYSFIVSPHPDDEYSAWSLIQNSPANYPVFIYISQGESTAYCDPVNEPAYQVGAERNPQQMITADYPGMSGTMTPWDGKRTNGCG